MSIQRINPSKLQTPLASYSQVVKKGPIITTAGLYFIRFQNFF